MPNFIAVDQTVQAYVWQSTDKIGPLRPVL